MTLVDLLSAGVAGTSWLEITANVINLVSIGLATRNSVHTWWTGLVGCGLFAALFGLSRLYADVTLQLFYIITSLLGWWQWLHRDGRRSERPITRIGVAQLAWLLPGGVTVAVVYGVLLHRFTDAYAPFVDSVLLVLSVIAQLLLMRRKLETWIFWVLVNSIAAPLYASRGLWLTAIFYVAFWGNAFAGYFHWRRLFRQQEAGSGGSP